SGSLRAKFDLSEGPSKPTTLAVQFLSEGNTLSGVDIELVGTGYRLSLVKKRFATVSQKNQEQIGPTHELLLLLRKHQSVPTEDVILGDELKRKELHVPESCTGKTLLPQPTQFLEIGSRSSGKGLGAFVSVGILLMDEVLRFALNSTILKPTRSSGSDSRNIWRTNLLRTPDSPPEYRTETVASSCEPKPGPNPSSVQILTVNKSDLIVLEPKNKRKQQFRGEFLTPPSKGPAPPFEGLGLDTDKTDGAAVAAVQMEGKIF
ncbi:hypothetical protein A6R68_21235, partial [Neotoma lepida]